MASPCVRQQGPSGRVCAPCPGQEHGALQHLLLLGAENINSCCQEDTERFSL